MNDCKSIYRKVNDFVKLFYPVELKGNLLRNMNTLATMITGIIIGKETQLPKIALNVPENIKVPSTEKRIKRLLINEKVTEQTYFLPFIQNVLAHLGLEEIVLAIDGSLVGRGCICLMISLIYNGRALPLAFKIVEGKKGHLPEDMHVEVVKKLHPLIPESTRQVIFLGDGEFDGTTLQQTLAKFGWKYVCRTAYNITIYADNESFQIDILATILPKGHCKGMKNCQFTNKKYGPVTAVAWWGSDHNEPIFLVTNFKSAEKACDYYAKRFTIETFFSDQKSRGFNISKSHLSCPKRLTRLMMASCLAYLWVIFFWDSRFFDWLVQTDPSFGSM
ncbi:transposase [Desulfosarcina ovata subsp. sediminis]|uniref:Transposase n=1 Tax=Desulfosarcina ovata subsp. sediminis TaxID=885957 RepID=A0A5K8A1C0_9BACT|nr:transposase [Desulfosarcina ovata]BBO86158.1 transposase [Desulfosarcina ovata subsp. sediminis]